jgi:hypothetical protein
VTLFSTAGTPHLIFVDPGIRTPYDRKHTNKELCPSQLPDYDTIPIPVPPFPDCESWNQVGTFFHF